MRPRLVAIAILSCLAGFAVTLSIGLVGCDDWRTGGTLNVCHKDAGDDAGDDAGNCDDNASSEETMP
jgi:hypothetical protein